MDRIDFEPMVSRYYERYRKDGETLPYKVVFYAFNSQQVVAVIHVKPKAATFEDLKNFVQ